MMFYYVTNSFVLHISDNEMTVILIFLKTLHGNAVRFFILSK